MPPAPTAAPLPAPRTVLNALLDRITTIPLPLPPPSNSQPTNPLSLTPPSHRHLLTTLHVLFPTLLLPALDLLDRRLVARVTLDDALSYRPSGQQTPPTFHLISSSIAPHPRRRGQDGDAAPPVGRFYVVRLGTWHCTCAGFALALAVRRRGDGKRGDARKRAEGGQVGFGGTGVEGVDEGTPVCKHLLACLLAERWRGVLGGYVRERRVGREEMGGLVAGI
ncbi:ubiquitin carboxyl-terminal hydrolase family protein [Podospora conica]|nr:ubiquitin carboxyl-terminal hydrolase family protein [Schizothecium conicum]